MWPAIVILLLLGVVALHFWWRRRYVLVQDEIFRLKRAARDVAEAHDQALAQARAQQDALFNSMIEGVLVLDANGRIQLANQALQQLTGATHELRGKTVLEAFRAPGLSELVQRVSFERCVSGVEIEWPGLSSRCLQVSASVMTSADNRPQGTILVFHDLTRIRQLENTRQDFVANVSHELRTPLSLIKGYVETLIDGAKDDPAMASRFLQTILKHADRLTYLIEDLLTLSQLESGRAALNFQRIELRPAAERVLEDLAGPAREKGVALRNEVPEGLLAWADSNRLQQVIFNLIDNGIKYGRQGGFVEVAARRLDEHTVELWVKDNGPGIPPESLERIFERFYRVDRARSREQGGTGLGLSIVKHIVQSHGGKVWVKSDLGQGSTFFFTVADNQS
jgi:two-component system, OmpR family, phosphate regulon sensor histidine kinase PhoR